MPRSKKNLTYTITQNAKKNTIVECVLNSIRSLYDVIRYFSIFQLCKCKLAQTSGKKQCLAAATCGAARVDLFQPGAGSWNSPPEAYATDATVTACNLNCYLSGLPEEALDNAHNAPEITGQRKDAEGDKIEST